MVPNAPNPDCSLAKPVVDVVKLAKAPPGAGVAGVVLVASLVVGFVSGVAGGVAMGVAGAAGFSGELAGVVVVGVAEELVAACVEPKTLEPPVADPKADLDCCCSSCLGLSAVAGVAQIGFVSPDGEACVAAVLNALGPAVAKLAKPPLAGVADTGFGGVDVGVAGWPKVDLPKEGCPNDDWPKDDCPKVVCPKEGLPNALPWLDCPRFAKAPPAAGADDVVSAGFAAANALGPSGVLVVVKELSAGFCSVC